MLYINDIWTFRNENWENKFISFSHNNCSNGVQKILKNLGISITYKTKKEIFYEVRKIKLGVTGSPDNIWT